MARKNFLFSGSGKGAESSCFLFSLIETAKFNGKAPEDYLRVFLNRLLMPKRYLTGKNFCHGILRLHHSRFAVSGWT